ncbi:MAG: hypothetical protein IT211_06555 [Armatimonadetes bacterium]|nr:hypothetical protein [Armatimonadota bacterium]
MNTQPNSTMNQSPLDQEIERDVAELRMLLRNVEGPKEPHPAYWQNFVVHVHNRIDERSQQRRRRSMFTAWASATAAVGVTLFVMTGGLSSVINTTDPPTPRVAATTPATAAARSPLYADAGSRSLILSEDDVKVLNAIIADDDNTMLAAIANSDSF